MFKMRVIADMLKDGVVIQSLKAEQGHRCFAGFSGYWQGWTKISYPLLDTFSTPNYKKGLAFVGMDKLTFVNWWWDVLQSWGITNTTMDISDEGVVKFTVDVLSGHRAPVLSRLTLCRYLQENPGHLFSMVELGKEFPELFSGSPEKTWAAFCLSQYRCGLFFESRAGFEHDDTMEYLDISSTGHGILPQTTYKPIPFSNFTKLIEAQQGSSIQSFFPSIYDGKEFNTRDDVLKEALPHYQRLFNQKETKDAPNTKFVAA